MSTRRHPTVLTVALATGIASTCVLSGPALAQTAQPAGPPDTAASTTPPASEQTPAPGTTPTPEQPLPTTTTTPPVVGAAVPGAD